MKKEQIDKLPEITNFEQLYQIELDQYETTVINDLMLLRQFYFLADWCLIIIGADALSLIKIYKMSHKTYYDLTETEKAHIERYYK